MGFYLLGESFVRFLSYKEVFLYVISYPYTFYGLQWLVGSLRLFCEKIKVKGGTWSNKRGERKGTSN